ncbi:MAG TPA: ion channel [Pseudonocardia sp.]|nr:ion channel [Pseudonocardia sp.]
MTAGEPRLVAWERWVDWPLTGLAVVFLGLYAFNVLDTRLSHAQHDALDLVLTGIWVVFGVDFVVRLVLAQDRRAFFRTHLLDVVILLLPMARPLRALRVLTVIRALNRRLRGGLHGKAAVYVVATTLLVGLIAALAVLDAERNAPHATITTFGDAIWWTLATIATVGYGDLYPVTTEGRIVAGTLMIAGIALLGVITGSFASWFVASLRDVEEEVEQTGGRLDDRLDEVLAETRRLAAQVQALENRLAKEPRAADDDRVAPDGQGR